MAAVSAACLASALVLGLAVPGAGLAALFLLIAAGGSGMNAALFWRARNRRPAINDPAIPLPPTYIPPPHYDGRLGRLIPWQGRTGRLRVTRPLFGRSTTLTIDGAVVASPPRATVANPWVECPLPGSEPMVTVIQAQLQPYVFRTLVFVDGVSLDDGRTLDSWRASKPIALDRFEQTFFGRPFQRHVFGPPGAVLLGLAGVLPVLVQLQRTPTFFWAGVALLAFMIPAAWVMLARLFIRWLRTKRLWPWRVRNLMVAFEFVGLPILVIAILQAVTSSH